MDERTFPASGMARSKDAPEAAPWSRVCEILDAALLLPAEDRKGYVEQTCAGDDRLRSQVEGLLAACERPALIDLPPSPDLLREFVSGFCDSSPTLFGLGTRISHYEIIDKIGEGGMGSVFKAIDISLDRTVAVKVISRSKMTPESRHRFAREARAASALNNPHIITIYEYGSHGDVDFIAMEYVEGLSLDQVLKSAAVPVPTLLKYALQVATALAKAHSVGIAHRDLKPANIMITPEGSAKVLDFGLAKRGDALGAADTLSLTQAGMIMGTPAYMSPEQALGRMVDIRSDIFSFGVILYEMLCGVRPFEGDDAASMLGQVVTASPKPPLEINPSLPVEAVALVERCLCKDRTQRLASMDEAVSQLSTLIHSVERTLPQVNTHFRLKARQFPGLSRRTRIGLSVAAGLVLLICGALAIPGVRRTAFSHTEVPFIATSSDWVREGERYLERYDRAGYQRNAIDSFQQAIVLDSTNANAYARLADAYLSHITGAKTAQWAKLALDSAQSALKLNPYQASAHASAAAAMIALGQLDQAAGELQEALILDPKNAAAHSYLGTIYERKRSLKDAEIEFRKAVELDPTNWLLQARLGNFLYSSGRPLDAIQAYQAGLRLGPDNAILNADLGAAFHALGQDDDAAAAFQRSLEAHPSPQGFSNLGTLLYFIGRYSEAAQAFERALSLDATSYLRWGNLGDACRWTPGKQNRANEAYRQAIKLIREEIAKAPDNRDLRSLLATYLAKSGDKPQALAVAESVKQTVDPDVACNLALAYELCQNRPKALQFLKLALADGYSLKEIENEPEFNELRKDPAYQTMATQFATSR